MEIFLNRKTLTAQSTIGEIFIGGSRFFTLEDKDRGLTQAMPLAEIKAKKVFAKTAIPAGTYEVVISYSPRFKMFLPELLAVKGFEGIRIHAGNSAADTEGCILLGTAKGVDYVYNSKQAFASFMLLLQKAVVQAPVFITIQNNYQWLV